MGYCRIVYDSTPCTRCGGSGNYSFNQMYGTVCFKCRGSGSKTTKAGMVARAAVDDFFATFNRPASEVVAGDVIHDIFSRKRRCFRRVLAVRNVDANHTDIFFKEGHCSVYHDVATHRPPAGVLARFARSLHGCTVSEAPEETAKERRARQGRKAIV